MPTSFDQLLPSLQALGLWSYWIIGLSALLEGFLVTGIFVPGTFVVLAGGMLVQQDVLDYFDLVWFVAIGSVLGGEASYWVGLLARKGLENHWHPEESLSYQKAEGLFRRFGGFALILGRFLGPASGFVSFSASVSGMSRRRFLIWNIASGFPFALGAIAAGYFLGNVLTSLGPLATRLALFAAAALVILAVLWWLMVRIARSLSFLMSILRSVVHAIGENPDTRAWAVAHPRTARFMASRFDQTHFGGLTATLLGMSAAYILSLLIGSWFDVLHANAIVSTDMRLANLAHAFWTPGVLWFFAHVTALGDWRMAGLILLAALVVLLPRRRWDLSLALGVAALGTLTSVALLKYAFDRPRPDMAYFIETASSFPSIHAALSVSVFGLLFYIGWRLKWLGPVTAAFLAASVAFMVGLSRLYLIENFLSDVLNGGLVGGLWLVIGIAIAEWWYAAHPIEKPRPDRRRALLSGLAASVALLGAAGGVAAYNKPRNHPVIALQTETVISPAQIFTTGHVPVSTESIGGTALEPVNVILVARDMASMQAALQKAGWVLARKPGVASLSKAAWAALANLPDDTAPVTPYFWNGMPNDVAFQRPTHDDSVRKRHHVRFWKTRFLTADGQRVFVGAASFDNGFDRILLHHIAPNIDAERARIVQDLQQAGVVGGSELMTVLPPHMGQSVAGDPWFTDGKAALITLP